jgi:hypothetical protein
VRSSILLIHPRLQIRHTFRIVLVEGCPRAVRVFDVAGPSIAPLNGSRARYCSCLSSGIRGYKAAIQSGQMCSLGPADTAALEFQDRCLKPLGHPSSLPGACHSTRDCGVERQRSDGFAQRRTGARKIAESRPNNDHCYSFYTVM